MECSAFLLTERLNLVPRTRFQTVCSYHTLVKYARSNVYHFSLSLLSGKSLLQLSSASARTRFLQLSSASAHLFINFTEKKALQQASRTWLQWSSGSSHECTWSLLSNELPLTHTLLMHIGKLLATAARNRMGN